MMKLSGISTILIALVGLAAFVAHQGEKRAILKIDEGKRPHSSLRALSIVCYGVGLLLISLSFHLLYLAHNSHIWPQTSGTIIESKLNSRHVNTQEGVKVINAFTIKYEYRVNNHKYVGGTVAFGKLISPEAAVDKYKPGDNVDVYYHPAKATRSVLEPGMNAGNFMGMLFGIALIGVASLITKSARVPKEK